MLEEFRRRKNLENYREKEFLYDREAGTLDEKTQLPRYEPDKHVYLKRNEGPVSRFFSPTGDEIFDPSKFTLLFMETDSTCLVTKLNRINSRRVLVFIGNGNGVISYAKGKGPDYQAAFQNAFIELKKNMIVIDLDPFVTLGAPLFAKFNDFRLWLHPRKSPNYWGSQQMMYMLIYTGIYHVRFTIKSRKNDRYSMIYAYFKCVTKIKKPADFAKITGRKHQAMSFISPLSGLKVAGGDDYEMVHRQRTR